MKVTLVVCALVIVASILMLAREVDIRQHRITQLECSLAAAWAHVDTLETMLTRLEAE